ncbi:MAG: hypothetical protein ACR2MT_03405 [Aurantibacter sp.]
MNGAAIIEELFNLSSDIRYAAIYHNDHLDFVQREQIGNNSSEVSDKYEELLVNPTLLKLAGQRGNIDCGGLRYLIVGYGNFYQIVKGTSKGHVSICIEKIADLNKLPDQIFDFLKNKHPELELAPN